ncbi:hypothetical protein BLNAU_2690 [Blattamonas nauphoetae]|uniref:Protein-tyrosine-phosphatase n=1 Tax=Blattamonas nauphoetae TaxID=2049346 RepID=A0ABQ9YF98_9EUKA|nr:hypothetical protein BLNAU_2690 [Blattamonas nauphoetae]
MKNSQSDISYIYAGIFVGNQYAANDAKLLADNNITRILRLRTQPASSVPPFIKSITFCQIEDITHSSILTVFDPCFVAIREALIHKERIIVHCAAGKSRSPCVTISFLVHDFLIPLKVAYPHVWKARKGLWMNSTFKRQLSDLEYTCLGYRSLRFCTFCGDFDCNCLKNHLAEHTFRHTIELTLRAKSIEREISEKGCQTRSQQPSRTRIHSQTLDDVLKDPELSLNDRLALEHMIAQNEQKDLTDREQRKIIEQTIPLMSLNYQLLITTQLEYLTQPQRKATYYSSPSAWISSLRAILGKSRTRQAQVGPSTDSSQSARHNYYGLPITQNPPHQRECQGPQYDFSRLQPLQSPTASQQSLQSGRDDQAQQQPLDSLFDPDPSLSRQTSSPSLTELSNRTESLSMGSPMSQTSDLIGRRSPSPAHLPTSSPAFTGTSPIHTLRSPFFDAIRLNIARAKISPYADSLLLPPTPYTVAMFNITPSSTAFITNTLNERTLPMTSREQTSLFASPISDPSVLSSSQSEFSTLSSAIPQKQLVRQVGHDIFAVSMYFAFQTLARTIESFHPTQSATLTEWLKNAHNSPPDLLPNQTDPDASPKDLSSSKRRRQPRSNPQSPIKQPTIYTSASNHRWRDEFEAQQRNPSFDQRKRFTASKRHGVSDTDSTSPHDHQYTSVSSPSLSSGRSHSADPPKRREQRRGKDSERTSSTAAQTKTANQPGPYVRLLSRLVGEVRDSLDDWKHLLQEENRRGHVELRPKTSNVKEHPSQSGSPGNETEDDIRSAPTSPDSFASPFIAERQLNGMIGRSDSQGSQSKDGTRASFSFQRKTGTRDDDAATQLDKDVLSESSEDFDPTRLNRLILRNSTKPGKPWHSTSHGEKGVSSHHPRRKHDSFERPQGSSADTSDSNLSTSESEDPITAFNEQRLSLVAEYLAIDQDEAAVQREMTMKRHQSRKKRGREAKARNSNLKQHYSTDLSYPTQTSSFPPFITPTTVTSATPHHPQTWHNQRHTSPHNGAPDNAVAVPLPDRSTSPSSESLYPPSASSSASAYPSSISSHSSSSNQFSGYFEDTPDNKDTSTSLTQPHEPLPRRLDPRRHIHSTNPQSGQRLTSNTVPLATQRDPQKEQVATHQNNTLPSTTHSHAALFSHPISSAAHQTQPSGTPTHQTQPKTRQKRQYLPPQVEFVNERDSK